jgi:hypothetical protein
VLDLLQPDTPGAGKAVQLAFPASNDKEGWRRRLGTLRR